MNAPSGVSDFARLCWTVVLWVSLVVGVAIFLAWPVMADVPPEPKAEATVLVRNNVGLGTGFHIGGGFVVTAAHVAGSASVLKVSTSLSEQPRLAAVVFVDHINDIAILKLASSAGIEIAALACRSPILGEEVMLRGHPYGVSFLSTWGHISGVIRKMGDWRLALPVDISAGGGFSGGPLFDHTGKVIGVHVGQATNREDVPFTSLAVPSTTVCQARDLLGLS